MKLDLKSVKIGDVEAKVIKKRPAPIEVSDDLVIDMSDMNLVVTADDLVADENGEIEVSLKFRVS